MPKFTDCSRLDYAGNDVPAVGFKFDELFITNARLSECGRFTVSPQYYGLSDIQADELQRLNDELTRDYYANDVGSG